MIQPITDPFQVIVADCPWEYNDRREYRRDNPEKRAKSGVGAAGKYRRGVMKPKDLLAMGPLVRAITAPKAYLFQWATCPRIGLAIAVMEAWGFKYKTVAFSWEKLNHKALSTFCGSGRYTFSNIELLLLGVKGGPFHPNTGTKPRQCIRVPHPRDPETNKEIHSRKPEEFQDAIDRWLRPHAAPGVPFLELFATRQRPDWICLGDDLTETDIRDDLAQMSHAVQGVLL